MFVNYLGAAAAAVVVATKNTDSKLLVSMFLHASTMIIAKFEVENAIFKFWYSILLVSITPVADARNCLFIRYA